MNGERFTTEINQDARFGIVGAGTSGLTAAHYLAEAGYERVTLLEKRPRVGGKCESIAIDGRVYEMGAVLRGPHYAVIRELSRRVGLAEGQGTPCHFYTPEGARTALFPRQRLPALIWQLFAKFAWLTAGKYQRIYQPGLAGIHPDLHQNFQAFAAHHGLPELPALFQPLTTGFGYGYAEQVPAAYMLKYLNWTTILSCARGEQLVVWPDGIQTLWERLAYEHDLRLGVRIRRVTRGAKVTVHTARDRYEFDYLVLACPLDRALVFLDATAEEQDLFGRIQYYDYWVLLGEISGLPPDTGFIRANFALENQGHLMIWCRRWPQTKLYTLYALGDFQTSEEVITANIAADLRRAGAHLEEVLAVRRWRYFPHVPPADMAAGFYERLEAMQGIRRTFYCGEIMSFSTLESSARYARDLVERFFPAGAAPPLGVRLPDAQPQGQPV